MNSLIGSKIKTIQKKNRLKYVGISRLMSEDKYLIKKLFLQYDIITAARPVLVVINF